jgi:hypothetical protein
MDPFGGSATPLGPPAGIPKPGQAMDPMPAMLNVLGPDPLDPRDQFPAMRLDPRESPVEARGRRAAGEHQGERLAVVHLPAGEGGLFDRQAVRGR